MFRTLLGLETECLAGLEEAREGGVVSEHTLSVLERLGLALGYGRRVRSLVGIFGGVFGLTGGRLMNAVGFDGGRLMDAVSGVF